MLQASIHEASLGFLQLCEYYFPNFFNTALSPTFALETDFWSMTYQIASLILHEIVQLIYYGFFTQPSPAFGVIDFYVLNPLDSLLRKSFKVADLTLRDRLGGGNYGQVNLSHIHYYLLALAFKLSPQNHGSYSSQWLDPQHKNSGCMPPLLGVLFCWWNCSWDQLYCGFCFIFLYLSSPLFSSDRRCQVESDWKFVLNASLFPKIYDVYEAFLDRFHLWKMCWNHWKKFKSFHSWIVS